jgi:hypothetical protein
MYKKPIFLISLIFLLSFYSCELLEINPDQSVDGKIIPTEVYMELPGTISTPYVADNQEKQSFETIYNEIRNYVFLAQKANEILAKAYQRIIAIEIQGIQEFAFTANDGNTKYVSIRKDITEDGVNWEYSMEIYNETFSDLALKAYWNISSQEQYIIFKPSRLNINEMQDQSDAIVKIIFKKGESATPYQKSAFICIDSLNIPESMSRFPENIFLFVGQNGNLFDVIGSADFPYATIIDSSLPVGRNLSFRGKVESLKNISVLQLALTYNSLENTEDLMNTYAIKKVILAELRALYPAMEDLSDDELLIHEGITPELLNSPVYLDQNGFVNSGTSISSDYSILLDFDYLIPFVPREVRDFHIAY